MKFCSESKDSDILLWICGLTIYKSRLVSHNKSHNAIIGGPHTSFQALAEKAGNVGALLTHFTEGLKHLRSLGPPRIPVNPLSTEDEFFAISRNGTEFADSWNFAEEKKDRCCSTCFMVSFEDDCPETLKDVRMLRIEQESGMEIRYRCVKCRKRSACKNGDKSGAISLKEEAGR